MLYKILEFNPPNLEAVVINFTFLVNLAIRSYLGPYIC